MGARTAPPMPVSSLKGARRAKLVFSGVDLAGPSFEGRVFLNNVDANESTRQAPEQGYVGSFHVYGYGKPAPPTLATAQGGAEGEAPIAPIEKRLDFEVASQRPALEESDELTVTVVPVPVDPGAAAPERPFEHVGIVVDPATTEP